MQNLIGKHILTLKEIHIYDNDDPILRHTSYISDAMLSTCTALRNYKRCGSIPKAVGIVLRAVAPTAPVADHLRKRRQPCRGWAAIITMASRLSTTT